MLRCALAAVLVAVLVTTLGVAPAGAHSGAPAPADIWFPVQDAGEVSFPDTYGDCRGDCSRSHQGVDVMAPQMNEVYAATDGEIFDFDGTCETGEYCSSYSLLISGDDGRSYFYVHLNNDTPGRPDGCDGRGGMENAFAPRLVEAYRERGTLEGVRVFEGEHIAYVGSSGNAGCGVDHLHFELWDGHGWGAERVNPYSSLRAAWDADRVWGPAGVAGLPAPAPHEAVAGDTRVETSVELSRAAYEQAGTVVLAPADVHPEALVSGPLAAAVGGPVLLVWERPEHEGPMVADTVIEELQRLGASSAVLVGSPQRLSERVEQELVDRAGLDPDNVRRIAGSDPYALSHEVADEVLAHHGLGGDSETTSSEDGDDSDGQDVLPSDGGTGEDGENGGETSVSPLLALGEHPAADRSWPDALSASVLAARQVAPVLLTRPDELPAPTAEVLSGDGIGEVRIVGGSDAIDPAVEQRIRDDFGLSTRRLAGADRFETATAVAEAVLADGAVAHDVYLATGRNFPDALAAGPAVAALGQVLLLVEGADESGAEATFTWLREHADATERAFAVGGRDAVAYAVLRRAAMVVALTG